MLARASYCRPVSSFILLHVWSKSVKARCLLHKLLLNGAAGLRNCLQEIEKEVDWAVAAAGLSTAEGVLSADPITCEIR
ncbi:hypothetical protein SADUNF_Sadunf07G0084500 [Salix dunnii]|uniref:Uncharacterized protein n=1 Tax=Salix dunnii TaxID=1413687 RepID=A0A835K061_9ROSI|nr:hypothetical protein SADUNF_Sadunf07G0084500 [Salix dunnii]